jgi:hypothetical protein
MEENNDLLLKDSEGRYVNFQRWFECFGNRPKKQ